MPSDEEWIKDLQQRLKERKREEREREEQEQDQRVPPAGDRPRPETLANPRPSPSQPAADTTPGTTQAGGGLNRDDPFGEVTGGAAVRSHVTLPPGGGGTSERDATSISFEGGAAATGTSAGVAQTSTNTETSADTDVGGGDHGGDHADLDDAALMMVSATADATTGLPENAASHDESDDREVDFG